MSDSSSSPKLQLMREVAVLQVKLLADGLRDAFLIPLSLLAAAFGLIRGGSEPDRELRQVIAWGRRSEHWIDLFGRRLDLQRRARSGPSLDALLDRVEEVVTEQYRKGRSIEEARTAISAALRQESATSPAAGGPEKPGRQYEPDM